MSDIGNGELRTSPLHDRHLGAGAKMADFGGWLMPIDYGSGGGGVVKEHAAVRESVGLFDVSHLGKATVVGPGAVEFLNRCLSNDLDRIRAGQAQYTLCCNDSGGVVDDLIAYIRSGEDVLLVPNAANTARVVELLAGAAPSDVVVTARHGDYGVLAVQGPRAAHVLAALGLPADLDYMSFVETEFAQSPVVVCRTGYTGEAGYELLPTWEATVALWDALVVAVEAEGGRIAGLGARDTLRTEMGYPLHGQDLSESITPVQAGSGWAVGWSKPEFWGSAALAAERAAGPSRRLVGLQAIERAIPRPHMTVIDDDGQPIGEVTSGTFSPTLSQGIALALIDSASGVGIGDEVALDVRGRAARMKIVKPPFVPSHVR
jgi:aminomethyltransferase